MEFTDINSKIKQHTCGELINRSQRDTYLQVSEDASLDTAISVMAQFKAYRVPVVSGEDNDLMGVLSQSLIVKFLAEHMDRFPDLDKKTIKELNIGFRTVISVNKENSVKDTLLQIRDNRVGGIAVVDNSNKLVGTISASDLKSIGFGADFLGAMYMPISWLLSQTPRQKDRPYPLVLKPDVTIAQVLKTFDETKVHRLFIVNEDMILQGVVTLTDVLQMFHDYGLKKQK
jgi:5'-AMP-activated protein kinase regulatory gamma subunit